jgi:branched-chain amino acid transport system substrate-binding protein
MQNGSEAAMPFRRSALCVATSLLLITCAPHIPAQAGSIHQLRIAILVPLTGAYQNFGVRDGALFAVDEWNARGGVRGMRITPVVEDSQCIPDAAVITARKLIDQDRVRYIIGEVWSQNSIRVSEVANAAKVIMVTPTSTHTGVTVDASGKTKAYVFRACFADPYQGRAGASFAFRNLKAKRACILYDPANDYSRTLAQTFEDTFKKLGGTIVSRDTYDGNEKDFSVIMAKLKAAKPDIVYLPDDSFVVNAVTKQAKVRGIRVPFIGGDEWDPSVLDLSSADGGYCTNHYFPGGPLESVQKFIKAFSAAYREGKGPKVPDVFAALGYDAMNLLLTAVQNAGSDDTDKVKAALESINYEAVTGRITFDAQHNPLKGSFVLKVTAEGFAFSSFVSP